jgi:hypothetical protein
MFYVPKWVIRAHLNIYVPRFFQWYKELIHPMIFYPYNCPLKIQKSIGTPIPRVGAHLGVRGFIPSHSPMLLGAWIVTPGVHFWLAPLQTLALVVNPRLRLWQCSCTMETWRFENVVILNVVWKDVKYIIFNLQPCYVVLHLIDQQGCTLSLLYEFMLWIGRPLYFRQWEDTS